jgi:hypothetical protein
MCWPEGALSGGKQKGAEAGPQGQEADGGAVHRCHHRHRDTAPAGPVDAQGSTGGSTRHRQPEQKGAIWGPQRENGIHLPGPGATVEPGELPGTPKASAVPVARVEYRIVPGPGLAPHGQEEPKVSQGVRDGATLAAGSLSGTEPGGRYLATFERDRPGQSANPVDGGVDGSCPGVHSVPLSHGTLEESRSLVR